MKPEAKSSAILASAHDRAILDAHAELGAAMIEVDRAAEVRAKADDRYQAAMGRVRHLARQGAK